MHVPDIERNFDGKHEIAIILHRSFLYSYVEYELLNNDRLRQGLKKDTPRGKLAS